MSCRNCGKCCTDINLWSEEEINKLKSLDLHWHNYNTEVLFLRNAEYQNICPLLGKDKKCIAYPFRGESCRHFDCSGEHTKDPFKHQGKKVVSLLLELDPDAVIPEKPKVLKYIEAQNLAYQIRKKGVGLEDAYTNL